MNYMNILLEKEILNILEDNQSMSLRNYLLKYLYRLSCGAINNISLFMPQKQYVYISLDK